MLESQVYDNFIEEEMARFPKAFMWNKWTKLMSLVPIILMIVRLIQIMLRYDDLKNRLTFVAITLIVLVIYGRLLYDHIDTGLGNKHVGRMYVAGLVIFILNIIKPTILGIVMDVFIVWILICLRNYRVALDRALFMSTDYSLRRYKDKRDRGEEIAVPISKPLSVEDEMRIYEREQNNALNPEAELNEIEEPVYTPEPEDDPNDTRDALTKKLSKLTFCPICGFSLMPGETTCFRCSAEELESNGK